MTRDPSPAASGVAPRKPATLAEFGALIGDPVRAVVVLHLSDGSRRPAGELAELAGTSPQGLTRHLARLVEGGLLRAERQGRHRFFRLASGEAAEAVEALAHWIDEPRRICRHDPALADARLCYDHLAGRLGVALFEGLVARGMRLLAPEGSALSDDGRAWCERQGLDLAAEPGSRRPLLRLCFDWTERRPHLGGRLGAALATRFREDGLLMAGAGPRALAVTHKGAVFLRAEFGIAPAL